MHNKLRMLFFKIIEKFKNRNIAIRYYLKPYVKIVKEELKKQNIDDNCPHVDKVWTMWFQEEVPEIIQVCLNTISQVYPNAIIITEKNLDSYVTVPNHIKEKFKKGIISAPHYSDYIRTLLLDQYGGLWLDASLYMLNKVPDFITKQDFFALTGLSKKSISNFFLYSAKGHYVIKTIRIFLEEYWKRENFAIDYFFYHKFFMLMTQKSDKFKKYYEKMEPWLNSQVKYLIDHPSLDYSSELWQYLKKTSFMYKLNRKNKKATSNKKGFYQYLIDLHNKSKKDIYQNSDEMINTRI